MIKQLKKVFALSLLALPFSGCTSLSLGIANTPAHFFKGSVIKDIIFDTKTELALDIYQPKGQTKESLPVIVFFYGGSWSFGDKSDYAFVASYLADQGYVVVVPNYRLYPDVRFPAFVEDSAHALNWVHASIDKYSGDPQQIYISGHSAGAHIGSLLTAGPEEFGVNKDTQDAIKGFAGLAGPYSFIPKAAEFKAIFESTAADDYRPMQATSYIDGSEPPMFLQYGEDDKTVYPINVERMQAEVKRHNGCVAVKQYKGLDHVDMVGVFSVFKRYQAPVAKDMVSFFNEIQNNKVSCNE